MSVSGLPPQPTGITPWMQSNGTPALIFLNYMLALDSVIRNATIGPLTNAANDAAAAAAGVQINQLYRNGSVVQIRVT